MSKAIIVVSFGTTYPDTRKKTIQACEETIQQRFPDFQVHRAFTSNVVIKRIKENEGISVPTVNQLLEQLKKDGVKEVYIQPLHIILGSEYEKVVHQANQFKEDFELLKIGKPLLFSEEDYENVANILVKEYNNDDVDEATILMGHGSQHLSLIHIFNPMSEESWKASITIELTMLYNQGYRSVVLAPGNYGEDFATNVLGIPPHRIVNMSNFVGHVLKEVQRIGFTRVLMVGHMGKFVKVAGGIFSTHSKDSDARMEIIMANLALLGAPVELLEKVDQCITTDAAGTLIEEYHYEEVYQEMCIRDRC